ncbi:MAG: hypothetical protein JWR21_3264 [Herminiimonas sp.]|nr:hypothetical protein [Herminiimonas sp.]
MLSKNLTGFLKRDIRFGQAVVLPHVYFKHDLCLATPEVLQSNSKGKQMLLRIKTLATAALMFVSVSASASHIVYVQETFGSGAAFSGNLTFSDNYLALLSGTGTLSGGVYGSTLLNHPYYGGLPSDSPVTGATGNDWLLDGPASGNFGTDYHNYIGFVWKVSGGVLTLLTQDSAGFSVEPYQAGVTTDIKPATPNGTTIDSVRTVTVSLTPFSPPGTNPNPIPEPASMALIGLGLFGFVASRRKAAKTLNA